MKDQELCDCTVACPGRQFCEIGTWTPPEPKVALAQAQEALRGLGDWLHTEHRTTREVAGALFKSIPFADDPSKIDIFAEFTEALKNLGYESGWDCLIKGEPVGLSNVNSSTKPKNFQRVLELMIVLNSDWIMRGPHPCTSQIVQALFPAASREVLDLWLIQALDDCLYRIGFSQVSRAGDDKVDVFDDPIWFCDGDPKDALKWNLWKGEAVLEEQALMAMHTSR